MAVKRIVADLSADDVPGTAAFYQELLGLDVLMDQGWIQTLGVDAPGPVQLSIASQGGNDTPVPHLSIEVDDVDAVHDRAKKMGCDIPYSIRTEPWGVRRFYVADPAGRVINILAHQ